MATVDNREIGLLPDDQNYDNFKLPIKHCQTFDSEIIIEGIKGYSNQLVA